MDNATKQHVSKEIEKLAIMIAKGFAATATKDELSSLKDEMKDEMAEMKDEMNRRFDTVDGRLDHIEAVIERHADRLDRVVDDVRVLKTRAGIRS